MIAIPLAAMLADRIGRKPVFITGAVASSLVMFPYLSAITEGNWVGIFAYGVLMHGALYSMANGVWPAFYAEMFPTRVRVTGLALGTQIGFAISGGVGPGADLHNAVLPAVFTVAMCALVALGALTAREGYKKSLAELDA